MTSRRSEIFFQWIPRSIINPKATFRKKIWSSKSSAWIVESAWIQSFSSSTWKDFISKISKIQFHWHFQRLHFWFDCTIILPFQNLPYIRKKWFGNIRQQKCNCNYLSKAADKQQQKQQKSILSKFHASWLWRNDPNFIHPSSGQKLCSLGQYPGTQIQKEDIIAHEQQVVLNTCSNKSIGKKNNNNNYNNDKNNNNDNNNNDNDND